LEKIPPLSELIMVFKRHFAKFSIIIIFGMIASVIYALTQPRVYETTAMVQILQPAVPAAHGASTATGATLQRLQIAEQRLMARDNLLQVIEKYNLYPGLSLSEKILRFRLATQLEKIQDPALRWRSDVSPTALMIRVSYGDPEMAAKIANEFVRILLAHSREISAAKASEALGFFEGEKTRVGNEIAALDMKIASFKQKNAATMPVGLADLRAELVILNTSILESKRNIVSLRSELANVRNVDNVRNMAANNRLQRLEEQFALLDSKRQEIQTQLALGPEVAREFVALTRKLRQLTEQYDIINTRRAEAEMDQMLEASRQSAGFEVLEKALAPPYPISPNRKKITLMGIMLSIAVGLGLMTFLELWKPVVRNSSQLSRRLGIQPVIAIPTLQAPRYSIFQRIRMFLTNRKTKRA